MVGQVMRVVYRHEDIFESLVMDRMKEALEKACRR
jgi:hypothetical protein